MLCCNSLLKANSKYRWADILTLYIFQYSNQSHKSHTTFSLIKGGRFEVKANNTNNTLCWVWAEYYSKHNTTYTQDGGSECNGFGWEEATVKIPKLIYAFHMENCGAHSVLTSQAYISKGDKCVEKEHVSRRLWMTLLAQHNVVALLLGQPAQ